MLSQIIKMLLNFETSTVSKPSPWLTQFFGGRPSATGQTVNPNTALQVPAVFACIRVLSDSVASLPLKVFERLPNGGKRPALDHPLYPILHSTPNPELTSFGLRELIMLHLGLRGNAYTQIVRDGAFRVIGLYPLHPDRIIVMRDKVTLELFYRYTTENQGTRTFAFDEIWRVNGIGADGLIGYSPISLHREAIGLAMATEEHGARMFSNGATVPMVLEMPNKLTAQSRKNIEESWSDRFSGTSNAFKTPIMEQGMKLVKIGLSAEDAQFLQTRKFELEEIARIFRVPPGMIGDNEKAAFKNSPEQQALAFVIHSLRPHLVRLEQSIERDLMSAKERQKFFVQFDIDGLLRGDSKARAFFYKSAINDGWMTRNEVRIKENLNPDDDLEAFLVPLNMRVVGQDPEPPPPKPGKQKAPPSARTRAIVQAAATRVVSKEIKTLTKIINRLGAGSYLISHFYSKHKNFVMEVLAVDETFADAYVKSQFEGLINDIQSPMDVLAAWQDTRPETLTREILSLEQAEHENKKKPKLVSN